MIRAFPTSYDSILERIESIDPIRYARSRNYLDGAVTRLSPYLSRGVISLPQVRDRILQKATLQQAEKLLQELAWREFFQRVWQHKGDLIFTDLRQPQSGVHHHQIPKAILEGNSGIIGIDRSIHTMYETGYMHNHARMYTAMLTCNIAGAHWLLPAKWMYYHLLDGDLASNMLSWQWVAGSFSSKKYYANQENINTYTGTNQQDGFLHTSYEALTRMPVPASIQETALPVLNTTLPAQKRAVLNPHLPLFLYNSYQLDPLWHSQSKGNRVLLLEPSHFKQYPVSKEVLDYIIALATELIPNIQVVACEVTELIAQYTGTQIHYKEHPTTMHYPGKAESRDWLFPEVTAYHSGFFNFWKKCEKYLR